MFSAWRAVKHNPSPPAHLRPPSAPLGTGISNAHLNNTFIRMQTHFICDCGSDVKKITLNMFIWLTWEEGTVTFVYSISRGYVQPSISNPKAVPTIIAYYRLVRNIYRRRY